MINQQKAELRKLIIRNTEELSLDYIDKSDAGILKQLVHLPEFIAAETMFSYFSLGREPDTIKLLEYALGLGKTVTLPVCFKHGVMEARVFRSFDELSESSYHLLEPLRSSLVMMPEDLDFIIVPALTYDRDGYRLGRGGGYYDRFLAKTGAFTVGIAREHLLYDLLPRETHDIAVECVVTEEKTRRIK